VAEITFAIVGINLHNEMGDYLNFNNVSWHPIWTFICKHTPELISEDHKKGSSNDAHLFSGDKHFGIIRALNALVAAERRLIHPAFAPIYSASDLGDFRNQLISLLLI
jgi:hypothetical protein